jgi:hypothetical protein
VFNEDKEDKGGKKPTIPNQYDGHNRWLVLVHIVDLCGLVVGRTQAAISPVKSCLDLHRHVGTSNGTPRVCDQITTPPQGQEKGEEHEDVARLLLCFPQNHKPASYSTGCVCGARKTTTRVLQHWLDVRGCFGSHQSRIAV